MANEEDIGPSQYEVRSDNELAVGVIEDYRKNVLVIYTGGTLGMKIVNGSYSPVPKYLGEVMQTMPELSDHKTPRYTLLEYDPLVDSANMTQSDWIQIAGDIEKNYHDYDGFVVIHGTDTMAYTASALSFMLENLGKTVVLTGSCIPIVEVVSDGRRNLIVSLVIAAYIDVPEVCIFFNNSLLRGNRTSKVDAWGLNAFSSGYYPPLATLGLHINFNSKNTLPQPKGRLRVHTHLNKHVAVLRLTPGLPLDLLKNLLRPPLKGLVLQLYGVGTAPMTPEFLQILKDSIDRGLLIVCVTQCRSGMVVLGHYEAGEGLSRIGVLPGFDMTCEAAITKLMYILGTGLPLKEMKKVMVKNLRGEMSRNTDINWSSDSRDFHIVKSRL